MNDHKEAPKKRPRGRPTLRTETETLELLIQAARDVFLAEGYAGTSIEAVARQAGMSTRTIYKTVSNKANLFRLVADDAIETSIAQLDHPLDAASPKDAIFVLVRAYTQLVLSNDGVLKARAVFSEQGQFPEFRDNYLVSIQLVAKAFDQRFAMLCANWPAVKNADCTESAAMLRSLINGAQRSAILDPSYDGVTASIVAWSDKCTAFALNAMQSQSHS
jgi:AcrR family transcriptional regulator